MRYCSKYEENLEHIEIHIDQGGEFTKEVAIEENSQDYITDFDGKLFSAQYTLDVAFWDDTVVNAVVTDKFGQKTEVAIANHSSLKSRVTTSLVNLAAGISEFFGGALATGIAIHGICLWRIYCTQGHSGHGHFCR